MQDEETTPRGVRPESKKKTKSDNEVSKTPAEIEQARESTIDKKKTSNERIGDRKAKRAGEKLELKEEDKEKVKKITEKVLKKTMEKAMVEGVKVEGREIEAEDFERLKRFLYNKDEIDEEEEKSLLELLLKLLEYMYDQLKQAIFGEKEDYKTLVETAKSLGFGRTPSEITKFVLGMFDFSPEGEVALEEGVEKHFEENPVELVPDKKLLEKMRKRGWTGDDIQQALEVGVPGASGLSDKEWEEVIESNVRSFERQVETHQEGIKKITDEIDVAVAAGDDNKIELLESNLVNEHHKLRNLNIQLSDLGKDEREIADYLGRMYGTDIKEIYHELLDVEEAGVFTLLRSDMIAQDEVEQVIGNLEEWSVKVDQKKGQKSDEYQKLYSQVKSLEDVKGKSANEIRSEIRRMFLKPLFEEIVGDAESDPREGFRMENWGHIMHSTMMNKLKRAGPVGERERRRFENLMWTRRIFAFINSELIKGGDPQEIHRVSGKLLLSEDLDTIADMEPTLTPAVGLVERALAQVKMDPENNNQVPYEFLISGSRDEYRPPEVERIVTDQLLEMDKVGIINLGGGRQGKNREAVRMAALAVKTSNVLFRSAEHVTTGPLSQKVAGEHYKSYPFDKLPLRPLRMGSERFETWGRGREGAKPWVDRLNRSVQYGVYEKIPGDQIDEWWGINMENYLHYGGPFSGSTWRSLLATQEQRSRGVALGVDLYDSKRKAENIVESINDIKDQKEREEKRSDVVKALEISAWSKDAVKDGLKEEIWLKVGRRLPTVVARYFPTMSLREAKTEADYYDVEKRLREDIVSGGKKKEFMKYVNKKVEEKFKEEEIGKDIKTDVKKDVESKLVKNKDREIKKRTAQRKKELRLQIGAETSLNWMLAEEMGVDTSKDGWEEEVFDKWKELHKKISLYEEKALQDYLKDGYDGGKCKDHDFKCKEARDKKYKSVKDLVGSDDKLLKLGFSPGERKVVERLSRLGAKELKSARIGAERMAGVDFTYLAFMEDVVHEKAEWWRTGPRGVSRRIGGDAEFAQKTDQVMTKIDNGLHGQEDRVVGHRQELTNSLFELYGVAQHMGEGDRQKLIAAKADTIMENLYKSSSWVNWMPFGMLADWGGPGNVWKSLFMSSNAQRKYGYQALSMNKIEMYSFINSLRPMIGNELAGKLLKKHNARLAYVAGSAASQILPIGVVYGAWRGVGAFFQELGAQLKDVTG